jgi:hypothetical protein
LRLIALAKPDALGAHRIHAPGPGPLKRFPPNSLVFVAQPVAPATVTDTLSYTASAGPSPRGGFALGRRQHTLSSNKIFHGMDSEDQIARHPQQRLNSRTLEAEILYSLGRSEEALPIVQAVVAAQQANPALGPPHPDTLYSRNLEGANSEQAGAV